MSQGNLKNSALEYAQMGWQVIPLHNPIDGRCSCGKSDCGSVGKHPRTPHGLKDATKDLAIIENWWTRWPEANIGVCTGRASGLVALDVDPRHQGNESLYEVVEKYRDLPNTVESKTGGGGKHIFFRRPSREAHVGNKANLGDWPGLDVRADGGYVVAPPSLHASGGTYQWEPFFAPGEAELAPTPEWLLKLIEGKKGKQDTGEPTPKDNSIPEGNRNDALFRVACSMRHKGMGKEAIQAALKAENQEKCNPPLPESEVEGVVESAMKYDPDSDEGKQAPEKQKKIYTASFEGLVDVVEDQGATAFLVKTEGALTIQPKVEIDGQIYDPPPKNELMWLLPRATEVIKHFQVLAPAKELDGALYEDLLAYHRSISELPSEGHYHLISAWVMHTYLLEAFQYSPILCFFAVPERGKTRTGKGITYVVFRGIHVESLREANLLRYANDQKATLFFDVKNFWKKAEANQSEDVILLRFEKGAKVARVLYPDKGAFKDMKHFEVFGPTLIGTNENVHRILDTRSIQITMPDSGKVFEREVTPEAALELKERLLAFRARHLGHDLPQVEKVARARLGDILKPLHQVIRLAKPEYEPQFMDLVKQIQAEKLVDKGETYEGQIVRAILSLDSQLENGVLAVKAVTETFNEERSEREHLTPNRVGRMLQGMGFHRGRVSNGAAGIIWDQNLIQRLKETYGV